MVYNDDFDTYYCDTHTRAGSCTVLFITFFLFDFGFTIICLYLWCFPSVQLALIRNRVKLHILEVQFEILE